MARQAALRPREAALHSLALPGLGQRKLGDPARGNRHTAIAVGSMVLAVIFGYLGLPWAYLTLPFFLLALVVWAYSVFDAHRLAKQRGGKRKR